MIYHFENGHAEPDPDPGSPARLPSCSRRGRLPFMEVLSDPETFFKTQGVLQMHHVPRRVSIFNRTSGVTSSVCSVFTF